MARKEMPGTVADTALKYGTGSLNIGDTRLGSDGATQRVGQSTRPTPQGWANMGGHEIESLPMGRWPANVIFQHLEECTESACVEGCPVADLDEQSGEGTSAVRQGGEGEYLDLSCEGWRFKRAAGGFSDTGGASRFFKQVRSTADLLEYLQTMITPPEPLTLSPPIVLDSETMDRTTCGSGQLSGAVFKGTITTEQVEILYEWLAPGGHLFLIAPDDQPTGHTGAILLEEAGFELRDAILWVRGAGRLHYVAKASRAEREAGCARLQGKAGHDAVDRKEGTAGVENPRAGAGRTASHVKNHHPTVKAVGIMERLLADVPLDEGPVLDPFMGSGTTGIACVKTGHSFIGIEREEDFFAIADARVRHWDSAHHGWIGAEIISDLVVTDASDEVLSIDDLFE